MTEEVQLTNRQTAVHSRIPRALQSRFRLVTSEELAVIRPRLNRFLLAIILALYGVTTLCGPALHALPGFGHCSTVKVSNPQAAPGHGNQQNAAAHDCPICHFHAQGQLIADPDSVPSTEIVRIRPADEPQLPSPLAVVRPSFPRAPPLA
jgi:hypothetical protein